MRPSYALDILTALATCGDGKCAVLAERTLPRGQGFPALSGDRALALRVHRREAAFGFGRSDGGHFILNGLEAAGLSEPVVRDVMEP